jgi:hypothetical protein
MTQPAPTHLDRRDPANPAGLDIRAEADRELDHYGADAAGLVLLIPEEKWAEFLRLTGADPEGEEARYRGAKFRKGAVTAVVAQEGF